MVKRSLSVENNDSRSANASYPKIESIRKDSLNRENSLHAEDDSSSLDDTSSQDRLYAGQTNTRIAPVTDFHDYAESTDGNTTDLDFTSRLPNDDRDKTLMVVEVLDKLEVACTLIGTVANLFTTIALFSHHEGFSRAILTLLRHQTMVDCLVCAMASTLLLEHSNWVTGCHYVDVVVCHVWHGEALYRIAVMASSYNLVLLAYERYLAICRPFRHAEISSWPRRNIVKVFAGPYALSIFNVHVAFIRTTLKNGVCVNEFAFDGPAISTYRWAFSIFTCISAYLLPAVLTGLCYARMIIQLRRRATDVSLGRSNRIDRANDQITRTALAITIVFVLTVGYDQIFTLLRYKKAIDYYEPHMVLQKVGVFLLNLNSFSTPFIYAAAMPMFRRCVLLTLCCLVNGRAQQFRGSGRRIIIRRSTVAGDATGRSGSLVGVGPAQHSGTTRDSKSQSQTSGLFTISIDKKLRSVDVTANETST